MLRALRSSTAALTAIAVLAAGCGDSTEGADEPEPAEEPTTSTTTSSSTSTTTPPADAAGGSTSSTTTTTTTTSLPPDVAGPDQGVLDSIAVEVELVATANVPTDMVVHPGTGRILVAEREGTIVELSNGEVGARVLDISSDVSVEGEGGLLSIAFDPTGDHLYVSFTNIVGDTRVFAYEASDGLPDAGSATEIFALQQPDIRHNGGQIRFGPDGYLYVAVGYGAATEDASGQGQSLDTLLGKLLRIDPTPGGPEPYEVPVDNPFVGVDGALGEIWAYGLRNPWRFSFDRANGDLWIGDVGEFVVEEIDWVDGSTGGAGANFGWDRYEGPIQRGADLDDHVGPVHHYNHDDGRCSIIGGYVYRGEAIADLRGAYVYSDLCEGYIRALTLDNGEVVAQRNFHIWVAQPIAFAEDADGEIYVLNLANEVHRIVPA